MPEFEYGSAINDYSDFSDFLSQFSENDRNFLRSYLTSQNIAQKIRISTMKPKSKIESISLMWYDGDKWEEIGHYTIEGGTALITPNPHYPHHLAELIVSAKKLREFGKVTVDGRALTNQLIKKLWHKMKKE